MFKLGRAPGLVRYDAQTGLSGAPKRFLRPRLFMYGALGALGLLVASVAMSERTPFEANVLRLRDTPLFIVDGDHVRNAFEVHLVNKRAGKSNFELRGVAEDSQHYTIAVPKLMIEELHDQRVPVFVDFPKRSEPSHPSAQIEVWMDGQRVRVLRAPLVGPN